MQNELVSQGLNLMLLGMGIVFVFLTVLVFATTAMSKIIEAYFPQPLPFTPVSSPPIFPDSSQTDPRVLAAINLAIAEHRKKTRRH